MDQPAVLKLGLDLLADAPDFQLGCVRISPSRRRMEGPLGARHLQPQLMIVLLCLARHLGRVVARRSIFNACWPGAQVGDDSLNRTIAGLRHALTTVGAEEIHIETVPRSGYRLVAPQANSQVLDDLEQAVQAAWDCWRLGLPKPDAAENAHLATILAEGGGQASDWGILALSLRKSVEYADAPDCADLVRRCEQAARKALGLDQIEANARIALVGLTPTFGNWGAIRSDLADILISSPNQPVALHELAVLEMATGRPTAATTIIERLLQSDRFAATFHYKRLYQLWTIGDLQEAERMAARSMALWPQHPAIWMARFWTLVFTQRADQARRMADDGRDQNLLPAPVLLFLHRTAELLEQQQGSGVTRQEDLEAQIAKAVEFAALGPAQSVAALMSLCALCAIDQAFDVAHGYYLGTGRSAAPMRWQAGDPCITDQHRRVTQPLFVPSGLCLRNDPRFSRLCADIGLTAYWDRFAIVPDHLAAIG